ncbi:hypothetical protein AHIS2_p051 [Acaryochloris phage A-HIS2]|nr:hypothetical protein AHIS2_p051 [Acaryochloris phage A-HIS2]
MTNQEIHALSEHFGVRPVIPEGLPLGDCIGVFASQISRLTGIPASELKATVVQARASISLT